MKLKEGLYECLCGNLIEQQVGKSDGNGKKGRGSDMVKCKCGMLVSQKTRFEMENKK